MTISDDVTALVQQYTEECAFKCCEHGSILTWCLSCRAAYLSAALDAMRRERDEARTALAGKEQHV